MCCGINQNPHLALPSVMCCGINQNPHLALPSVMCFGINQNHTFNIRVMCCGINQNPHLALPSECCVLALTRVHTFFRVLPHTNPMWMKGFSIELTGGCYLQLLHTRIHLLEVKQVDASFDVVLAEVLSN